MKQPQPIPPKSLFPMRINKYLAWKKYATRKGGDELVEKKKVFINGRIAVLGDKVLEQDKVEVMQSKKQKEYVYYAYNKPVGIVTHSAQDKYDEKDVKDSVPLKQVFPVGRLDKESEGLMILTNDSRITDSLLNPEFEHDKEYLVTTKQPLRSNFKEKMEAGVDIEGYKTKPCKVTILDEKKCKVTLTEGKKHQIRRMVSALFNDVDTLKRTRVMNIQLGSLKSGDFRQLKGEELKIFLASLGF